LLNQESRLPPGSDFRRWVWITIAPFVTMWDGWFRLQDMVEGYLVMKSLSGDLIKRQSLAGGCAQK
ncbi:hypothetical protein ACLHQT_004947, partial [Escherichia coli]